jgi:hypothetical protein
MPIETFKRTTCDLCSSVQESPADEVDCRWVVISVTPENDKRRKQAKAICPECKGAILEVVRSEPKPAVVEAAA